MKKEKCERCGLTEIRSLIIHHKLPKHLGGSDDEDNLMVLCRNCHYLEHWGGIDTPDNHKINIPTLYCKRCKHTWMPRNPQTPKVCPKCNSPYWNKDRGWYQKQIGERGILNENKRSN